MSSTGILNIGPNAEAQGSNTGSFQNRFQPSGNAIWTLGKHTVSFGASYGYTQLNTIDKRTGTGTVATDDLSQFAQGFVTPGRFVHRLLRQLLPSGQRQPLLPRQPARLVPSGQVPGHPNPEPHRWHSLRLGRRTDRGARPHLQLRSISLQLQRRTRMRSPTPASSSPATTRTARRA